ncbi:DUF339-domain-containing protein [Cystobasidium minutum MCA 4210]|uniref:DUF339-domain-containing protein n=1 Tax=Cystobasidium minutum MCA 4210 TaxID=1397322 RepID=UPI0034CD77A1|eukprot:jgi/Rhomi1/140828/e_gw1.2.748.1
MANVRCVPSTSSSAAAAVRYLSHTSILRSSSPSIWNKSESNKDTTHEAFKDVSVQPTQADDPWAIPMQHKGTVPEDVPMNPGSVEGQHPEGRDMNEDTETMRARLVYLSRKRGILEMEMLLSTFIQDTLKTMTREEMQEYDRMLTLPDWTLFYWAIGKKEIPADSEWKNSKVLAALSKHAANDGKSLRRMPEIQAYGVNGVQE